MTLRKNNTTGYTGLKKQLAPPRWHASIMCFNKRIYLGAYLKIEKAIRVRKQAEEAVLNSSSLEEVLNKIEIIKRVGKVEPGKKRKKKKLEKGVKFLSFGDLIES